MKPTRVLLGATFSFSLLLAGCGESAGVESLSPEEMDEYLEDNNEAYILLTRTSDDEEWNEQVEIVDEINEDLSIKEMNAYDDYIFNNELEMSDLGMKDSSFRTLGYYEEGEAQKSVDISESQYSSEKEREDAIQAFIDQESE